MIETINEDSVNKKYRYKLTALKRTDLVRDMAMFWEKLLTKIQADREDGSWNSIFFECWVCEGYVIAYPQRHDELLPEHFPEVIVDLDYLTTQQSKYDSAKDAETLRGLHVMAYIDTSEAISSSYRKHPALAMMKETLKKNDFKVYAMRDNDLNKLIEFPLFF